MHIFKLAALSAVLSIIAVPMFLGSGQTEASQAELTNSASVDLIDLPAEKRAVRVVY